MQVLYISIGAFCMVFSLIQRPLNHLPFHHHHYYHQTSSFPLSSSSFVVLIHHHYYHHQTHIYLSIFSTIHWRCLSLSIYRSIYLFVHVSMYLSIYSLVLSFFLSVNSPFHELGIQGMIAEVHLRRIERLTVSTVQVNTSVCVTNREYAVRVC